MGHSILLSARIPKILSHLNFLIRDNDILCIDKLRMDRNAFHILASLAKNIGVLLVKPNPVLEHDSDDRWKWFKGCLGALDGTYISIRVEAIYKPRYRTRNRDIATNVLRVCDRNLNFIYVLPGWEGSVADGRVLRDVVVRRNRLKVINICEMEDIQMEMVYCLPTEDIDIG
uniref:DDE Tnp4 domain-containing protein n=1 Tax=Solanum lycopersicum TaxID=4081 RepID=A0A3Q7G1F5_SOLLC